MDKRINMRIVFHVDADKTTITEQLLYNSGAVRQTGSVDKGTAQTDFMWIERERGISVKSASTVLTYKDTPINLIDTPGHMDFFLNFLVLNQHLLKYIKFNNKNPFI